MKFDFSSFPLSNKEYGGSEKKIGILIENVPYMVKFQKNTPFLAISKLRLSTYLCTPSGIPKLKFWLSLPVPKLFSYPLE